MWKVAVMIMAVLSAIVFLSGFAFISGVPVLMKFSPEAYAAQAQAEIAPLNQTDANISVRTQNNNEVPLGTALDPSGSISGRVLQPDGVTPVSSALVRAISNEYSGNTSTDFAGNYTVSGLPSGQYRVYVSDSRYLTEYYNNKWDYDHADLVTVTAPGVTSGINFILDESGSISGCVYGPDGITLVSGANVRVVNENYSIIATSGNYTISGLHPGDYIVRVSAPGYLDEYYDGARYPNSAVKVPVISGKLTPNINFILDKAGSISGRVCQADGVTPVAGASITPSAVQIQGSGSYSPATSEADGSYLITGLPSGKYQLRVDAAGYLIEYYDNVLEIGVAGLVSVAAPETTANINFSLETGGSISGCVYQPDAITPLSGVLIFAEGDSLGRYAQSDLSGNYTINGLPSGNYWVQAECSGYPPQYYDHVSDYYAAKAVFVVGSGAATNINFVMDTGGSISGCVYQPGGVTPASGAQVIASSQGYSKSGNADVSGNYTITGLIPGEYYVYAHLSGFLEEYFNGALDTQSAVKVPVSSGHDTPRIDFVLRQGGSISGKVYQADGVTPLAGAIIFPYSYQTQGSGNYISSVSAVDGSYVVSSLPPGTYKVRAVKTGCLNEYFGGSYFEDTADLVTVSVNATTQDIDFKLDPGGSISGHVFRSDGKTPISHVSVCAELKDKTGNGTYYAITGEDGGYLLADLPPGSYTVRTQASNNGNYLDEYYPDVPVNKPGTTAAGVVVTPPLETPDIDFTLDEGGTISGQVYQSDGLSPWKNIFIQVCDLEGTTNRSSVTDDSGYYYINGLHTGRYMVFTRLSSNPYAYFDGVDFPQGTCMVDVKAPENTSNINFYLDYRVSGIITGYVYAPQAVAANAHIYVRVYDALTFSAVAGSYASKRGYYKITGLPPGDYLVVCEEYEELPLIKKAPSGHITSQWFNGAFCREEAVIVTVLPGVFTANIDFHLEKGGAISGIIYNKDGKPVSQADLEVYNTEKGCKYAYGFASNGAYGTTGLPDGRYRLRVSSPGYASQWYEKDLVIEESQDITGIDFYLEEDTTFPDVVFCTPPNGAEEAPVDSEIRVTFSEPMKTEYSRTETPVIISPPVKGSLRWEDNTLVFKPLDNLAFSRTYTVSIPAFAVDLAGHSLESLYSWSFTTRSEYLLTVNTSGQGTVTKNPDKASYSGNETVELTAVPAAGWNFSAWSGNLTGSDNPAFIIMDSHKSVTAGFTVKTIDGGGGGSAGGAGGGSGDGSERIYLNLSMGEPGVFIQDASARSSDGMVTILIPKGTVFKTPDGAGSYVTLDPVKDKMPPAPPGGNIIGLPYQLGPEGSTFDPPIQVRMLYLESQMPQGISAGNLVIGHWDGTAWQELSSRLNAEEHSLTADVSHFSRYAVITRKVEAPPLPAAVITPTSSFPTPTPSPAVFLISSLVITPQEAVSGETVKIETVVANNGGAVGTYDLVLKINGAEAEKRSVSVAAGKTEKVVFEVRREGIGQYAVEVNGKTGLFTVKSAVQAATATATETVAAPVPSNTTTASSPVSTSAPDGGDTGSFVWWIIGVVVILAAIAGIIWVRRRSR